MKRQLIALALASTTGLAARYEMTTYYMAVKASAAKGIRVDPPR